MKVYISADMEGISGIVSSKQVISGNDDYERARKMMTKEVNTMVDAFFFRGANEVLVNDSHASMDNILIEEFDERAELICGSPKPLSMMEGIDESFDFCVFLGYHGRAGKKAAVMDHLYSSSSVFEARINGEAVSEAGLNGRLAGYFGVPVALVTGDQNAISCSKEELNDHIGIQVKEAIGRNSAKLMPFAKVVEKIREGVEEFFNKKDELKPTIEKGKINLEIEFNKTTMAEVASLIPGTEFVNGRTLSYQSNDYLEIYRTFRAMLGLASTIH